MKIKLLMGASESEPLHNNVPFMPLSLPLLAATAPGHDYTIIDLLKEKEIGFEEPVDLVGISVRFSSEARSYSVGDEFKKRGIPVVLGGPQVSAVPFEAIKHADSVVVGEADELWPLILADAQKKSLKQFYVCSPIPFKAEGYTVHQIFTYPELNNVKNPLRYLAKPKYAFDTLFASRGCPIDCDFCAVPSMFGREFRLRPVQEVVAEIQTLKRRFYYLIDDSVFGKPSIYDYYIELYTEIAKLKKRKYWTGQANLDAVSTEKGRSVIVKAQQAGLLYAAIGIESINPEVLKSSGASRKNVNAGGSDTLAEMKEAIRFIQDLGIVVSGWFVIGYEQDTIDTYYRTYEFCQEMNILPAISPVIALPGTKLYEKVKKNGALRPEKLLSNIAHPTIKEEDILTALTYINKEGFSWKNILKRSIFYYPRFRTDQIEKNIFLGVLHVKMRQGIDVTMNVVNREYEGK
jgi:radical SAM superfamily enzyme YgiQ (UPF0313 family)